MDRCWAKPPFFLPPSPFLPPHSRVCVHGASVSDRSLSSALTKHSPCPDYGTRMSTKGTWGSPTKKLGGEITCSRTFYDGVEGSEGNGGIMELQCTLPGGLLSLFL